MPGISRNCFTHILRQISRTGLHIWLLRPLVLTPSLLTLNFGFRHRNNYPGLHNPPDSLIPSGLDSGMSLLPTTDLPEISLPLFTPVGSKNLLWDTYLPWKLLTPIQACMGVRFRSLY